MMMMGRGYMEVGLQQLLGDLPVDDNNLRS